ncbi:magnesium and cobalt efflux protein CorC [Pedobacter glucosidilyticus]|nr:hemolysin family protein [Pedobacter glucosidilyticus]KHJ38450.1 magnesium and cobalt efflux protein CorC [Pedobacter glucosidilyticus]
MEIIIIIALILLNGVFSMSEIALVSSRKFKLESAAKKGNKNAKKALELANHPNTFLSTVQIGITLIGILTGIFSGNTFTSVLTNWFNNFHFLQDYSESLAVITVVVSITYLTIVFGELIPKRLGLSFPEKIASFVAIPMTALSTISKPLIWLLAKTNDLFLGIFGFKEKQDGIITEEEIKSILSESTKGGEIEEIEHDIVKRVFSLGDRKVGQLMTHRHDVVWINKDESLEQIREKVNQEPHSVYPVCDTTVDKVLGFISIKILFSKATSFNSFDLFKNLSKPLYVPENMPAYRVLEMFKIHKSHSAIVLDEYGSLQGIITKDDVLDELIDDSIESEDNQYQIIQRDENSWFVDGQLPFFELLDFFNLEDAHKAADFTTVAGLFISLVNHIPKTGEKAEWNGFILEVLDMDDNRVDKLLITIKD